MRALYDEEDLLATIWRRLDRYVLLGQANVACEGALHALIRQIGNRALREKARAIARRRSVEAAEGRFADLVRTRTGRAANVSESVLLSDIDRGTLVQSLSPDERDMLRLWLVGWRLSDIARWAGISPATARKRLERIRAALSRKANFKTDCARGIIVTRCN